MRTGLPVINHAHQALAVDGEPAANRAGLRFQLGHKHRHRPAVTLPQSLEDSSCVPPALHRPCLLALMSPQVSLRRASSHLVAPEGRWFAGRTQQRRRIRRAPMVDLEVAATAGSGTPP
jgi:hypothetical protein